MWEFHEANTILKILRREIHGLSECDLIPLIIGCRDGPTIWKVKAIMRIKILDTLREIGVATLRKLIP